MADTLELIPQTPAQRLAAKIIELQTRVANLERTTPRPIFGFGPPSAATGLQGSMYVDQTNGRLYFLGPGPAWVSADLSRASVYAGPSVSTNSTSVVDLGGPSLGITVPASGFVMALATADITSVSFGGGITSGGVWLYEPTDIPNPAALGTPIMSSDTNTIATRAMMTSPNSSQGFSTQPNGGVFPYGDMLVFQATPGFRTYTLRYSAWASSVATFGSPSFANRRLTLVTL